MRDEDEAKSLIKRDPGVFNKKHKTGLSGLTFSLNEGHHSLTRWLLSLPGIDTNYHATTMNVTPLHIACSFKHPLDIVIALAKLTNWDTVNKKTTPSEGEGKTALDLASFVNPSAALYLTWLGVECKEGLRNCYYTGNFVRHTFTEVTLDTWRESGCLQDAQFWAVAANDLGALKSLVAMKTDVKIDKPKLRMLSKLFNHREIWSYLSDLQSLAWERLEETVPAAVTLPPEQLLEEKVVGSVVNVLLMYRVPDVEDKDTNDNLLSFDQ